MPNSRFALHGKRPSLTHSLCAFFASNSRFMRLFQAALDTYLDNPFFASLSVRGLHFTVYAPSKKTEVVLQFSESCTAETALQHSLFCSVDVVFTKSCAATNEKLRCRKVVLSCRFPADFKPPRLGSYVYPKDPPVLKILRRVNFSGICYGLRNGLRNACFSGQNRAGKQYRN